MRETGAIGGTAALGAELFRVTTAATAAISGLRRQGTAPDALAGVQPHPTMNTYRLDPSSMTAACIVLTLWLAPLATLRAQTAGEAPPGRAPARLSTSHAESRVSVAPPDVHLQGIANVTGKPVRAQGEEPLGFINDYLVHPETGEVLFAIVASGSTMAQASLFRLVPYRALQQVGDGQAFELQLDRTAWDRVPVVRLEELKGDRVAFSPDRLRQVGAEFPDVGARAGSSAEQATAGDGQTDPSRPHGAGAVELLRISGIQGMTVRSGDAEVGQVQDVVLSPEDGTASALLEPSPEFGTPNRRFLVPLHRLHLQAQGNGFATSNLSRSEFDRAQLVPSSTVSRAPERPPGTGQARMVEAPDSPAVSAVEPSLAATGRTGDAYTADVGMSASLTAAVRAVRQAVDNAEVAATQANVQVVPENGRVVLRGSVENPRIREELERLARSAAPQAEIVNQITVEN
jgi:hypothetical protein